MKWFGRKQKGDQQDQGQAEADVTASSQPAEADDKAPIPDVSLSSPLDRIQSEPPELEHADGNKLQLASEAKVVEGLLQSTQS